MLEEYIGKKVTLIPRKPKEFVNGTVKDYDGEFLQIERIMSGPYKPTVINTMIHRTNVALIQER